MARKASQAGARRVSRRRARKHSQEIGVKETRATPGPAVGSPPGPAFAGAGPAGIRQAPEARPDPPPARPPDVEDWSRRGFYATMRDLFRDRLTTEQHGPVGPVPPPFHRHRPLSLAEFQACADKYMAQAVQRARRTDPQRTHPERYRHRWDAARVAELLQQIHEADEAGRGRAYFAASPRNQARMRRDHHRAVLAARLVLGGGLSSGAGEARVRSELKKALGRARTPVARLCRALLRRDVLPPVKARLSVHTDTFDLPRYHARREFLWTFLREEARPTLGTRWFASARAPIPSHKLEAVARALHRAYPWLPAPDPPLPAAGPPPPLTAEQIAEGLTHPDPARADTARRFGFPTPDALRMARSRRRRER